MRRAIQELSADHRSVITLRYVEERSYQEIARMMDCPIGTVKSRIHYALEEIAEKLAPGGRPEGPAADKRVNMRPPGAH